MQYWRDVFSKSEDYVTTFWHGSEGVVKTGLGVNILSLLSFLLSSHNLKNLKKPSWQQSQDISQKIPPKAQTTIPPSSTSRHVSGVPDCWYRASHWGWREEEWHACDDAPWWGSLGKRVTVTVRSEQACFHQEPIPCTGPGTGHLRSWSGTWKNYCHSSLASMPHHIEMSFFVKPER